jgi:hypothetical protein
VLGKRGPVAMSERDENAQLVRRWHDERHTIMRAQGVWRSGIIFGGAVAMGPKSASRRSAQS